MKNKYYPIYLDNINKFTCKREIGYSKQLLQFTKKCNCHSIFTDEYNFNCFYKNGICNYLVENYDLTFEEKVKIHLMAKKLFI